MAHVTDLLSGMQHFNPIGMRKGPCHHARLLCGFYCLSARALRCQVRLRRKIRVGEAQNEAVLIASKLIEWPAIPGAASERAGELGSQSQSHVHWILRSKRRVGRMAADKHFGGRLPHELKPSSARDCESEAQGQLFPQPEYADMRRLVDVPVAHIPIQLGYPSEPLTHDSVKAELQVRGSYWMRQKEVDRFVNRNAEMACTASPTGAPSDSDSILYFPPIDSKPTAPPDPTKPA